MKFFGQTLDPHHPSYLPNQMIVVIFILMIWLAGSTWEWDPGRSSPQCNLSQTAGGGHRDSRDHWTPPMAKMILAMVDDSGEFVCSTCMPRMAKM